MVVPTTLTCYGVLIPSFLREFDATIASASLVPAIAGAVFNFVGKKKSRLE